MIGIGFSELLIIAVVALVVLGPKQMQGAMRKIAVFYRQFLELREELRFAMMTADVPPGKERAPPAAEANQASSDAKVVAGEVL